MPATPSTPPSAADLLPADPTPLRVIHYPDPRLRRKSVPVDFSDPAARARTAALAARMLELMKQHKGVGLAAPQVGVNVRLFVMNATGEPGDNKVYVNPVLLDPAGEEEREEGCLSLPEIDTPVLRSERIRIRAQDADGNAFEEEADGLPARCWQHEVDHLDGVLILDKMPPTVRMAVRKQLKELEEEYRDAHPANPEPAAPKRRGLLRRRK